jgi:hypothetical protein
MAQGQIYGIPVSGIPREHALLDYGPVDSASTVPSGGDFGIEASRQMLVPLADAPTD